MSGASPGRSGIALLLRRPQPVDVADLRAVAAAVLPALSGPRLRSRLVERRGAGSLVELREDERSVRVHLDELADDMTRAGVPPTEEGIAGALRSWVAARPATDAAAATTGIAVLDWTGPARTAVGWRVVVRRGAAVVPWTPSPAARAAVQRTRSAALDRAAALPLDLRIEGPVALWSHRAAPLLAGAVLADPGRARGRLAAAGLPLADIHAVVTPHRPVACAEPAVAARLAGQTVEDCVTLPWRRLSTLPWS
ncbi:hypothetical protein OF117_08840 [Geodermatophilus sp. YIM 151500]|uniref:hypothetical protein n=1 Tax=Geodermatophilus sp. YIM 151500 TaxID=2984531 RepID=UPI0021E4AFA9|nr:hypothetical protein [Geodermatophilus sp. YIM 151500]MCV2489474.1 hypothetical protein [Geodermatophilus sp. YIM 151500]